MMVILPELRLPVVATVSIQPNFEKLVRFRRGWDGAAGGLGVASTVCFALRS